VRRVYGRRKRHEQNRQDSSLLQKKSVKKDEIERLVIRAVKTNILVDSVIDKLADDIIAYNCKESSSLATLKNQSAEVKRKIKNMLAAIEDGVYTSTTKQRLEELETERDGLEVSIAQEKIARMPLTKEQIVFWLNRFKDGDEDDVDYCRRMIEIFVNSIFLYDDRLCLNLNTREGTTPVTLDQMARSDLGAGAPPFAPYSNHTKKNMRYGLNHFQEYLLQANLPRLTARWTSLSPRRTPLPTPLNRNQCSERLGGSTVTLLQAIYPVCGFIISARYNRGL
jgi:hypothetical protein